MSIIKGGKVGSLKKLKASLKKGDASGYLARVPSDGSLTVRFLEEPTEWIEYYEFFDEAEKAFYPVAEGGPEPSGDSRPSKRFLANAVDTSDNKVIALVLPKTLAQSIMKKYERFNTLLDRDYEITREGSGFDTTYDVIPEQPSKMNLNRFTTLDLTEMLLKQLPKDDEDDDEDEDEKPSRTSRGRGPARGGSTRGRGVRKSHDEDEDEDDDAPWDDDEDEDEKPRKRPVRKPVSKGTPARKPVRKPLRK